MKPIIMIRHNIFTSIFFVLLLSFYTNVNAQTIIASDNFNRADEIPFAVGSNWQNPFSGGSANLIGNQVTGNSGEALYYWQGSGSFSNSSQYAKARVVNSSGQVGLILLGGSGHALVVAWNGGTLYIYRYSGGSYQGNLTTVSSSIQNGDIIEAVLDNGTVYAKINGTTVTSVANTTGITTGTPGFEFYQGGAVFDDWEAGTPFSNTYSISGNITEGGLGLSGVLVTASGGFSGNATTNANGDYTISGVTSGTTSITITPTLSGHTMNPLSSFIAVPVNANITNQDFTSTLNPNNILTITSTHGSVTKNPDQATYSYGTNVTLTATADVGYHFLGWSGDASGTTNPLVVTMNGDKNIKANFFDLNTIAFDDFDRTNESPLLTNGNWRNIYGWGNVNLIGNQVAGSSGEALYYWQGSGTFNNARQFARARVVNANGQVGLMLLGGPNQALNISWNSGTLYIYWYLNGAHQGELAHVSSTIHNGDIIEAILDGGIIYAKINGTIVHSVANTTSLNSGNPGFEFYQSGAIFDDWEAGTPPLSSYTITASASSGGSISPSGSVNVNSGSNQTFNITTNTGYHISDVLVDGISVGVVSHYTFNNVIANHTISASFAINTYTLTITSVNGTVTKNPDQANYNHGSSVQLIATPSAGYIFTGWSGDATGSTNPLTVTMDANKNITANFAINTYTLTITSVNGIVIKNPDQANYNHGSTVQLTASPSAGYTFTSWSGDATGSTNPLTVTMDENKNIIANFAINTYTLTITSVNGTVTKNPNQTNYSSGSNVQLTVTPSSGYIFTGWSGDASGSTNPLSITMNSNKNITANFTIDNNTYVDIGSTSANGGASITIPVSVHFGSGSSISKYILQGKIIFDPAKLKYRSNTTGSLFSSYGWTVTGYIAIAGQFDFVATGYNDIPTDGTLFNLNFDVISNITGSTLITSQPSYWLSNNSSTPVIFSSIHSGTVNITSQSSSTVIGDVDTDFNVDYDDAIAIINHVLNIIILNGQGLINADVDHNGRITIADAIGVILYCALGDWNYSLSILSPLSNAFLIVENPTINNNNVVLPINIKNTNNVRSVEVTIEYDPSKFSFDSFTAGVQQSNAITKANEVRPGQAKFVFASNELMNNDFSAGSITLKNRNNSSSNNGVIKTHYKINDRVEVSGPTINTNLTDVADENNNGVPTKFSLGQNFPNPFNPTTTIEFKIPIAGYYVVKVFNAIGQTVSILTQKEFSTGTYHVTFDGNDLTSGIYFYQLFGNGVNLIRKMMLIK